MRKLLILISSIVSLTLAFSLCAFADEPVISDAPIAVSTADAPVETTASGGSNAATGTVGAAPVTAAVPETSAAAPQSSGTEIKIEDNSKASSAPVITKTAETQAETQTATQAAPAAETQAAPAAAAQAAGPGSSTGNVLISSGPSISVSASAALISDVPTTAEYSEVGKSYMSSAMANVDLGYTVISPNHEYNGFKVAQGQVRLANGSVESLDYKQYLRGGYYRLLREEGDWYVVAANATQVGNYRTADGSRVTELYLKKSDCTASNSIALNTTNPTRQAIVRAALALAGKQYVYSGNGPDAFDCSGFVKYVMSQAGINVPRTSTELCNAGTQVGINGLRPGDICGRSGHVGIYIGNGYFIHASESATGVVVESVAVYNKYRSFTNYVNVVGD